MSFWSAAARRRATKKRRSSDESEMAVSRALLVVRANRLGTRRSTAGTVGWPGRLGRCSRTRPCTPSTPAGAMMGALIGFPSKRFLPWGVGRSRTSSGPVSSRIGRPPWLGVYAACAEYGLEMRWCCSVGPLSRPASCWAFDSDFSLRGLSRRSKKSRFLDRRAETTILSTWQLTRMSRLRPLAVGPHAISGTIPAPPTLRHGVPPGTRSPGSTRPRTESPPRSSP